MIDVTQLTEEQYDYFVKLLNLASTSVSKDLVKDKISPEDLEAAVSYQGKLLTDALYGKNWIN